MKEGKAGLELDRDQYLAIGTATRRGSVSADYCLIKIIYLIPMVFLSDGDHEKTEDKQHGASVKHKPAVPNISDMCCVCIRFNLQVSSIEYSPENQASTKD